MPGFYDIRCEWCSRRIGWMGELSDRPTCKCGHKPDETVIASDQTEIDKFKKLLQEKSDAKAKTPKPTQ